MKKSLKLTLFLSVAVFIITLLLSSFIIQVAYGSLYLPSVNMLRLLSLLIITMPLISIYSSFFIAQGNPQFVAKMLILSTIFNIILNYSFVILFSAYSSLAAVYGVCIATVLSNLIYLICLMIKARK